MNFGDMLKKAASLAGKYGNRSVRINVLIKGTVNEKPFEFSKELFSMISMVNYLRSMNAQASQFDSSGEDTTLGKYPVLLEMTGLSPEEAVEEFGVDCIEYSDSKGTSFKIDDIREGKDRFKNPFVAAREVKKSMSRKGE